MRILTILTVLVIGVVLISGCSTQKSGQTPAGREPATSKINKSLSSPFGIAFGTENVFNEYGQDAIKYIGAAGAAGFGIHVFWSTIEPKNNSYDWNIIDKYVDQIQPGDNAYIMVFTDGWCTTNEVEKGRYTTGKLKKGCPLLNENCKREYRDFIHALAVRSNGKIRYWQRDIEPATPKHWPAEKKEEYVDLQKIFYEEIKSVIPDAVIGGLGLAGSNITPKAHKFIDSFFRNARDYFDCLDIHLYQDKYTITERIRQVTNLMHNYGYEKPLIVKECGGPILSEYKDAYEEAIQQLKNAGFQYFSPAVFKWLNNYDNFAALNPKVQIFLKLASDEQNAKRDRIECRDMIQRYLIILNEGAQKVFWWNLMENHNSTYGPQPIFGKLKLLNKNHGKLPSYFCYQRMTDRLKGVLSVKRLTLSDTSLYFYRITKSGSDKPLYVLWHHDDGVDSYDDDTTPSVSATIPVELSGIVTVTDVFGNSYTKSIPGGSLKLDVDNTPVYIEKME